MRYERKGADKRYPDILAKLQKLQTEAFWQITADAKIGNRELILPHIRQYVDSHGLEIAKHTAYELCEKLYNDLQGYSILTAPLTDDDVEGIHINAWDNVRLQFRDGHSQAIDGFHSPDHAVDILRRMLQESHQIIDDAIPAAEGSIGANIRITALKSPVADTEAGVCCDIRKLGKRVFTEREYIEGDFADARELRFLEIALRRGVSILLAGRVNTGKTTFLSYLLSRIPNELQIITIEGGAREMNLVKRDESGRTVNNVMHLLTRESKDEGQNITQEKLVEKMLRLNPDIAAVAEMRNTEALAAQEASNSGHVVISTTHAGSPRQAHKRVANLCRKKYPIDFRAALEDACDAFPLVVFIHCPEDGKRRIMAVTECVVDNGVISYIPVWKYEIEDNITQPDESVHIIGRHIQVGDVSETLLEHMRLYGISKGEIQAIGCDANA